jgi:hypothetical protein
MFDRHLIIFFFTRKIFTVVNDLEKYKIVDTLWNLIVICISRMRNRTLTNREKNCRQGRFAAETRQSRGGQRIDIVGILRD